MICSKFLFGVNARRRAAMMAMVASVALAGSAWADSNVPFTEAKITEVENDVTVLKATTRADGKLDLAPPEAAKQNDLFQAPNILKTGVRSRAQLTAADGTIARVGSHTTFSFDPTSRTVHLTEGSILFNSPKGLGGGTIVTNSATATVLGTTIIVAATSDGGFKVLVLEGHAQVSFPGGQTVTLGPGQMTFVLPGAKSGGGGTTTTSNNGGTTATTTPSTTTTDTTTSTTSGTPGPVLNFDLSRQTQGSQLVNSFTVTLPSQNLVVDATHTQQVQISSGALVQTNQAVIGAVSSTQVVLVDSSVIEAATQTDTANSDNSNAVQTTTAATPLSDAEATSLTLNPSALVLPANIFTSPVIITAAELGVPSGLINNNQVSIQGLIAGTLSISGGIDLSSAFSGLTEVDLFGSILTNFAGNTTITLPTTATKLGIYGESLTFASGVTLIADFLAYQTSIVPGLKSANLDSVDLVSSSESKLDIGSIGNLTLPQTTIVNSTGNVSVTSVTGALSVINSSITSSDETDLESDLGITNVVGSNITGGAYGEVKIESAGALTVQSSTLETGTGNSTGYFGPIYVESLQNINLQSLLIKADYLQVYAGSQLTANQINLSQFSSYSYVTLAAGTLVLSHLGFPSSSFVTLYSEYGTLAPNPNTNATTVPGYVNFIDDVTYNGTAAQNAVGNGITLGITADNPGVQTALGQSLDLSSGTISSSNVFNTLFFTPSNIGTYNGKLVDDTLAVTFGAVAGSISASGTFNLNNVPSRPSGDSYLSLVGFNSFSFTGSTVFSEPSFGESLQLWSKSFSFASGSSIAMQFGADNTGSLEIYSLGALTLPQVQMTDNRGGIFLSSTEDSLTLNSAILTASNSVSLDSDNDSGSVNLTGSSRITSSAGYVFIDGGDVNLSGNNVITAADSVSLAGGSSNDVSVTSATITANNGSVALTGNSVTVQQSSLIAPSSEEYVNIAGGQVVTVVNSVLMAPTVSVSAGSKITMDTVNLNGATSVSLSARTIDLSNINFPNGSNVNLASQYGRLAANPNTNQVSQPGYVNFITNVLYNSQPAQNFVSTSVGGSSTNETNPIHISTISH